MYRLQHFTYRMNMCPRKLGNAYFHSKFSSLAHGWEENAKAFKTKIPKAHQSKFVEYLMKVELENTLKELEKEREVHRKVLEIKDLEKEREIQEKEREIQDVKYAHLNEKLLQAKGLMTSRGVFESMLRQIHNEGGIKGKFNATGTCHHIQKIYG